MYREKLDAPLKLDLELQSVMRAHLQGVISGRLPSLKAELLGPFYESAIVILICLSLWLLHVHPREPWHHFAISICWSNAWER